MKEDKKEKIVTTAVFFGKKKIKYVCYLFLFASLVPVFWLFQTKNVNTIFLISTILFVIFVSLEIKKNIINYNSRKKYIYSSILLGLIYILSFYL
jgi:4-hydroxybenzoate polyprenyltransferase